MENEASTPNENLGLIIHETPASVYKGVSALKLRPDEQTKLSAPFNDLDYEIRPDGHIYLPQELNLTRWNEVIGVGEWGIVLIKGGSNQVEPTVLDVFFDGCIMIRESFGSRAVGEARYFTTNSNQSWGKAFESAKTDCRMRCSKDFGIASAAYNPSFVRRWQKEHGLRVEVMDERGNKKNIWRRKDLDPFPNEIGLAKFAPVVPDNNNTGATQMNNKSRDANLPWLNHGPDYNEVVKEIEEWRSSLEGIKRRYKISTPTYNALLELSRKAIASLAETCKDVAALSKVYSENQAMIDTTPGGKEIFTERKTKIQKVAA